MTRTTWMAGLAGGLIGAFTMNAFARAVNSARGGDEADGATHGTDRIGRGAQPPQARGEASQDAAVQIGAAAYRTVTGRIPDRETRLRLGTAAHYAFSAVAGLTYAVAAPRVRLITAGRGVVYGTLVWAVADEGVTPALGLSRSPEEIPPGVHAYALMAHWVYGLTVDAIWRGGRALHERRALPSARLSC
jgi:hypothetical protein